MDALLARTSVGISELRVAPSRVFEQAGGQADLYKIKITTPQYRLAYHVNDTTRQLTIVAISSRDDVYDLLQGRV